MDILTMKNKEIFIKRRKEIKDYLAKTVYGRIPERPEHLRGETITKDESFAAGEAVLREISLIMTVDGKEFSMPIRSVVPSGEGKHPAFIYVDYESDIPSKYLPAEEIANRGYAIFCLSYKQICGDGADFKSGIAKYIAPSRKRNDAPGKIALLAWAISRVMDFAASLPYIDEGNIAVIGHGLYARAALVAGGYDERCKYVILNSLEFGENYLSHPHLFCKNFWEKADSIYDNLALSLCVPRYIMIGAAIDDCLCDNAEGLCSLTALNGAYELFGKAGLGCDVKTADEPITLSGDGIFYRLRTGPAYLSRKDWNAYIDYINSVKTH